MTTTGDILEPDYPFPPRYWWAKRIVVASVFLILAYTGLMWWWRYEARRRLNAEVAAIHARGEPILVEDFRPTEVIADEDNAAFSLMNAATISVFSQAELDLMFWFDVDTPIDDKARLLLAQISASSAKAREWARLARFQNQVDWNVTFASPAVAILLPHLNRQRELVNVLYFNAMHEHAAGYDAETVELMRDILRQARALERDHPVLVTHLVALSIEARACELVRAMSGDLKVLPDSNATTQPAGPASRTQVQALIAELLDETDLRQGLVAGLQGERLMEYDCAANPQGMASLGMQFTPLVRVIYGPAFDLDALRVMRSTDQASAASAKANFPAAKAAMPDPDVQFSRMSSATGAARILARTIQPSFSGAVRRHFMTIADRRVAALRLAIRLYQIDHDGQLPAQLLDLVPTYITALPADPLAADGRTFGYRTTPRPLIYSVGQDGADDGADTTPAKARPPTTAPAGSPDDQIFWDRRDVIFPLDRYVRPPPVPGSE